jgi:hypothetical protein
VAAPDISGIQVLPDQVFTMKIIKEQWTNEDFPLNLFYL